MEQLVKAFALFVSLQSGLLLVYISIYGSIDALKKPAFANFEKIIIFGYAVQLSLPGICKVVWSTVLDR